MPTEKKDTTTTSKPATSRKADGDRKAELGTREHLGSAEFPYAGAEYVPEEEEAE